MKFSYTLLSIILSFLFCTIINSVSINKDDDKNNNHALKYTGYDTGSGVYTSTTDSYTGYTSANSGTPSPTPTPTPTPSKPSTTTSGTGSTGTTMSGTGIYSTGKTSNSDGSYSGIINSGGWTGSGEIYTGSNSYSDYSSTGGSGSSSSTDSEEWSSVAQFILGFAEGLEMDLSSKSKLCFKTVNSSIEHFEEAFQFIEQGFLNVSKSMVEDGFKDLGVGLIELPAIYQLCKVSSFINEIKSLALKLSTGEGIITVVVKETINIYFNDASLTTEFKSAVGDYRNNNYFYFGVNSGKIVGILLKD